MEKTVHKTNIIEGAQLFALRFNIRDVLLLVVLIAAVGGIGWALYEAHTFQMLPDVLAIMAATVAAWSIFTHFATRK